MVNEIKISVRAYAKQLGVDESAVRKAIGTKGVGQKIVKGYDKKTKKIIPSIADKEWGFLHKNPKPQRGVSVAKAIEKQNKKLSDTKHKDIPGSKENNNSEEPFEKESYTYSELISKISIHPNLAYNESVRRKEILGIALDKMKLEELQGLLVRKSEIDKALYSFGVEFKRALLNIPARCINDVRAAPNDIEATNILNAEIQLALTHLPSELQLQKTS